MMFDANGVMLDEGTDPLFPDEPLKDNTKWVGEHRANCYLCAQPFKSEENVRSKEIDYFGRDGVRCQGRIWICRQCFDSFCR